MRRHNQGLLQGLPYSYPSTATILYHKTPMDRGEFHKKNELALPVGERDRMRGSIHASVTLVEYGDYQCPCCRQAFFAIKEILRQLGDQICFVFRNFPQPHIYPYGQNAAEAAAAAAAQSKFWEMHDTLFEHQPALDDGHLVEYAVLIGLDITRFLREMSEHIYATRVQQDFYSGLRSGVKTTPTFFINGIRYDGTWNMKVLLSAISQASHS